MLTLLVSTFLCTPANAEDIDWKVLRQTEVQASSFLQSNWNKYSENYHPNYVADDNPNTAWVEGVSGNGEGESIVLPTHTIKQARAVRLRIRNGYQKSEGLLKANAAPKDVRIAVLFANQEVAHTSVSLERKMGWQEVVVPLPEGKGLSAVSLRVDSVHPGSKYKDTCISDIVVEADTDVPYRPAIEAARLHRLLAWTQERKQTAAYFANLPVSYPFAGTAFMQSQVDTGDDNADEAMLLALEKEAAAASKTGSLWKRTAKGAAIEAPDLLWMLDPMLPLFVPNQLAWFETDTQYASRNSSKYDYGHHTAYQTNARLTFHEDGQTTPATIWFEVYQETDERVFSSSTQGHYVQCDAQGRPVKALIHALHSDEEIGPYKTLSLYDFRWNASGQIDQMKLTRRHEVLEGGLLVDGQNPVRFTRQVYNPKS